jgi:soluble lytic murein transglycosylase-like protein
MLSTSQIQQLVASSAIEQGVDPQLALSVAQKESNFNPNAVSSAGAVGVMQLMPGTAAGLGVTDSTDPTQNVPAGVSFLASLINQFGGDQAAALAAYNWGPANVQNLQAQYGSDWLSYAPSSVQSYVAQNLASVASTPPATVDTSDEIDLSGDDSTDFSLSGLTASGTSDYVIAGVAVALLVTAWAIFG